MDPDQLRGRARRPPEGGRAPTADYEKTLGQRDEDWPSWYAGLHPRRLRESG